VPDLYQRIESQLIGPGGPFEIVEEHVLGQPMPVFKNRAQSLRELLAGSGAHGDKEYIVCGDRRITFAEHLALVGSAAEGLRRKYGIKHGDRVAIFAENHPEWITTFWATVSLGGIVAALNGWWTADEARYGIELSEPQLIVADTKRIARFGEELPDVPILNLETDFADLLSIATDHVLPDDPIAEDDPAVILYTSGTTGRPKGALQTHRGMVGFVQVGFLHGYRNMLIAAERGDAPSGEQPPQCALLTSPLFHLSGLHSGAVMSLAAGGKTVWRTGRFEPVDVLRIIETERVTQWAGLGSMVPRVLSHPDIEKFDLSSLRNLGAGGAPTSPEVQARMRGVLSNGATGVGLGYGSSETVTAIAMIGGEDLAAHPTSVGRIQPTHQVEIRDPGGKVLEEGQEGEIFVRSPYNMLGYWRDDEATAKAVDPERWLATGDIGRFEDGRLYINSRARDLILRGAENVYPVEVEHRLEAHEDVVEAAVVGVDHPELGQEIKAIVVARSGAEVSEETLAAWVGATLAPFKVPREWEFRSEPLPRNATGKVLKNVLIGDAENRFIDE
jgi:acyl-CoA synthetase (AMP-forming)/AMP-acid ligase II